MALLVLLSTVSFTVEKHYCGDTLIDSAVFTKANDCGMNAASTEKRSCCKEEFEVIKGQDILKLSKFEELPVTHDVFLPDVAHFLLYSFIFIDKKSIHYLDYSPPNLVVDLQIIDQVFLI